MLVLLTVVNKLKACILDNSREGMSDISRGLEMMISMEFLLKNVKYYIM